MLFSSQKLDNQLLILPPRTKRTNFPRMGSEKLALVARRCKTSF